MYLKGLEIQGFKSFADKTVLEFNSGITSVVGPNGSGKSNISDAIRWVLGEQSIKNLRGSKMEDVIFVGTEHRKPLGFAEVSLTIDNSDGSLPVEYNEVTVTRRVYRSGESEFLLNKTACRLKDIYELFLDTGIGKDGYSIIGQGRIDEILSTRSEDRRQIFEEASGIMKYKVRKSEAEKKLELTRQNLLRINDIINELESQLDPLKQQSDTAKKYLALRDSLKELEINVFIDNISRYKEKIKELEDQYQNIKSNIESENLKLQQANRENSSKSELMKSIDERLDSSRQEYYNLETSLEKCSAEIKINEQKIDNLDQNTKRIDDEIQEIEQKIKLSTDEEASKNKKMSYLQTQYNDFSLKLKEYEDQLDSIMSLLDENEKHIENLKSGVMDKLDILSDKKTQINNIKNHLEGMAKRKVNIGNEVYQAVLEKDRETINREDLSDSISKTKNLLSHSRDKLKTLNSEKQECENGLEKLRKDQNKVKSDYQFKSSRYKMLVDMEKNLEGYNRSVKEILHACSQSPEFGHGIHGALAQLIKVGQKYETAIEMALGSSLQNIITSSEEDAKKAIEYLKKNKLGRATFLPVSSVKGRSIDGITLEQVRKMQGFCGVASDLLQYDSTYEGIICNLLGRVVVVENLDSGIQIARRFNYSFRIVTLEGDLLNTGGSMTGGSTDSRGTGILSRSREIDQLRETLAGLKEQEASLEKDVSELVQMLNDIVSEIKVEDGNIRNYELAQLRDESHLAQIDENIKRFEARIEMLKQEKEQLAREEIDVQNELEKYQNELASIENDIADTKKIISEYQEKSKGDQAKRDRLHEDITNYKISVNSITESMQSINEALERIHGEKDALQRSASKKIAEKQKNSDEKKGLEEKNHGIRLLIKNYEEDRSGRVLQMDSLTEQKKVLEEELYDIANQIQDVNKNIMLLQEEYSRIEIKKAKVESEMEMIQNRLWDEYELTYTNALQFKKDIGSIAQTQKQINEYRNQIKDLGYVNVAAIDDYVKTKERYEFMSSQQKDMEQSLEKLLKVIQEITATMKEKFIEQFRLINQNFNQVFRELFEGGQARLILADETNVLESGIEIEVQPPGKKLQNMMLLSGGERAFTAIALLFSILRLKPSPFCILDEIEAALDDANVIRFAQYLKQFSQQTQFIVVTHRKGTMEAADTLYGVTMQEHGISKVVSMKLGEKAS